MSKDQIAFTTSLLSIWKDLICSVESEKSQDNCKPRSNPRPIFVAEILKCSLASYRHVICLMHLVHVSRIFG